MLITRDSFLINHHLYLYLYQSDFLLFEFDSDQHTQLIKSILKNIKINILLTIYSIFSHQ